MYTKQTRNPSTLRCATLNVTKKENVGITVIASNPESPARSDCTETDADTAHVILGILPYRRSALGKPKAQSSMDMHCKVSYKSFE